ncbi:hypothetical protein PFICI_08422 [Pestalotiopsis fici W106-1]|uniref:NAD(P)-binding domain-containing protein n=1 Tax=Pestalotiopsis fici (strain W106-1 / CGMCC3.15140) TaxID=1229662 RepID=W3X427_PESFW|nr:uncharacterized protein PFICI_08422 [Pestalotiopsis fici W106-1]ETS80893.1 hypothetical protein PFICI_08422 [Pestalotiopsis fici W106-1]
MSVLLIGGTGKTALRVAALLSESNRAFLLASRRGPDAAPSQYPAIKFDWTVESTWGRAFEIGPVESVYLMEPQVAQPWVPMIKFVDFARQKGVKRFVLCAGTSTAIGKDGMGRVWEHFIQTGVDYCVLRPSWFMENLIEPGPVHTITKLDTIFTATQDGQIPFISADDIANVAYHALTDAKPQNRDVRVLGPEILTYDKIAATLSEILGRRIEHVKLDKARRIDGLAKAGVSDYYAQFLANLEVLASEDFEKATGTDVQDLTGRPPKSFREFAEENKGIWAPAT